ncbi:hypothetical protein [Pectobacterium odoriferum]|uniref:hypothetical protein n=1 Tax=Pectobacterium odoriferum TaxID=78398 RepID=UPI000C7F0219|nr:hypothetical protein [Pectobacterium odoriferum]MCA6962438.1 hypothetical protein [Pectobacterium odoriferum]MCH5010534.1 hypothetical protein [Pectobacterium odoriferum]PLY37347.1 hypothetical protein F164LOC_10180 [Pectobacterium carotovorum]
MFSEIKFSSLSDHALAELIKMAMEEFQQRLIKPGVNTIKTVDVEPVVLHAPSDNEMVFINNCLKKRRAGEYIHASMKDKYRDLTRKYPQWFSVKAYPDDLRGSVSKHYVDYFTKKE